MTPEITQLRATTQRIVNKNPAAQDWIRAVWSEALAQSTQGSLSLETLQQEIEAQAYESTG